METTTKETYRAIWRGREVAISGDFDDSWSAIDGVDGLVKHYDNSPRMALRRALLHAAAADGLDPNTWETMEEVLASLDAMRAGDPPRAWARPEAVAERRADADFVAGWARRLP